MKPEPSGSGRLDSWKAIASYLGRDERTLRRWERERGLPIKRVPGGRRGSVYAYASEIDAWLAASTPDESGTVQPEPPTVPDEPSRSWRGPWLHRLGATLALAAAIAIALLWYRGATKAMAGDLRLERAPDGVVAVGADGSPRWRYRFPGPYRTFFPPGADRGTLGVADGSPPAVYVLSSHRLRLSDEGAEGGELTELDINGRLRRSFSMDDRVTLRGTAFGPPWAMTSFSVDAVDPHTRRIAVAAHHWLWEPSVVALLDDQWQRRGTFVHAGWIEDVRWLGQNRLLVAGFSNAHDGGMVGLLDPASFDGQGPEPPGTPFHCESCGTGQPVRMVVMPRSEVNRAAVARFNRAVVELTADRIIARTIERVENDQLAGEAIYEFDKSLELVGASFGPLYWRMHEALEAQGKINHPRERCPDKDGPREIQTWDPQNRWRTKTIARVSSR